MQISWQKIASLTIVIAVLAFCGIGCSKKAENNPDELKAISNTHYTAPPKSGIPSRYENVTGVALFSISGELKEQLALLNEKTPMGSDQFFVLLNPKVPTEGILVKSPTPIDMSVTSMSNHQIAVTGKVVTIDVPDCPLVDCFQEKYGFVLAGDSKNCAVYIDAESINDPEAISRKSIPANATPAEKAEATPDPTATPDPEATANSDAAEPLEAELPNPTEASNVNGAIPEAATAQPVQDAPVAVPASEKTHSLQVTPAPKAKQPAPSAQVQAPAAAESTVPATTSAPAEAANDIPQDIAPTAQPLSSVPLPQDVEPTAQAIQ